MSQMTNLPFQENTALPAVVIPKTYPDGHTIDWHNHEFAQLVYACQGVMIVESQQNLWVIPPQRAVWIPAKVKHKVSMHGQAQMQNVYIQDTLGRTFPDQSCVFNISPLMKELLQHLATIDLDQISQAEVERLIWVTLDQLQHADQTSLYLPVASDKRLSALCQALLDKPANNDSLSDWATSMNISSRTLSRLFRKEMGVSFVEYRQQARLLYALKQLAQGMPVTTVALEVGFTSLSAFNRLFKRTFGTTPSDFFK